MDGVLRQVAKALNEEPELSGQSSRSTFRGRATRVCVSP